MDEFLAAIAEQTARRGFVSCTGVRHVVDDHMLIVSFEFSTPDDRALSPIDRWTVICEGLSISRRGPRFHFSEHSIEFCSASVESSHPLLWDEAEPFADVDMADAPREAESVVAALLEAHERAAQHWVPFLEFLRAKTTRKLRGRIEGGSCNIAFAPVPLAQVYFEVLAAKGCRPTFIAGSSRPSCPYRVFLFGGDYVIAESFVAKRER